MLQLRTLVTSYITSHIRNCVTCLGNIWRESWNSSITIIVIGVALALPTGLMLLLANIQKVNNYWQNGVQLSVFLKKPTAESTITEHGQTLKKYNIISNIQYISPQQALTELEQATEQANILQYLDENPLPSALIINFKNNSTQQEIVDIMQQIQLWPEVDKLQLDQSWLQKLNAMLTLADYLITIITTILALAVFLIIGNTIRLNIEKKKKHIMITKLMGATNAFIRREFLYLGFWYGLLGSIVAWLIVTISMLILARPFTQLAALYQSNISLSGLGGQNTYLLFLLGIMLGISGAWITVNRFLHKLIME